MKTVKTTPQFTAWMQGLKDRQAVARIRIRIDRLALGNPGQTRNLKGGVAEMKIDFGPGYRVYFTERGGELVILLCGGTKKGQNDDIALAIQLAAEIQTGA
ncbi:type II toxin-antitoxin system RelE/ParE family toxin [Novosphingobium sp.]|uniref:type II toxin-antitoxin system RelE/ParE family toxin n=1 Tax=Novosphingobium sp. TaxID=1874826 RepID=UPI0031CE91C5